MKGIAHVLFALLLPVLLLSGCGSETEAEKHYNAAVKILDSKEPLVESEIEGQISQALEDLDQAIRLDSLYTDAYFRRAEIYELRKRIPEAMRDMDQVIRLDPKRGNAYYFQGILYGLALEDHERAIENYTEAIRHGMGGHEHDAFENRADSYFRLGQYRLAIDDLDEVIRRDISYQVRLAHQQRGEAYARLGEYQRAIDDYPEAIRLDPEGSEGYRLRGQAFMELGEFQNAIEDFDFVVENGRRPDWTADAYHQRAIANTRLGNDAEAQEDVERAVELGADAASLEREIEEAKANR